MLRYTNYLNRIRNDIAAHPDPDATNKHDRLLVDVMNTANAEAEVVIPDALHRSGQQEIKHVSATTIAHLIEGKRIARTVRRLLPEGAGNQRLMIMHRNGFNRPMTEAAQTLGRLHAGVQWRATSSVLAGGGNCREHAEVAFEIARSLGLPVALVANHRADHVFAILYPDASDAVVIDPWTVFPSSCLLSDSSFHPNHQLDRHRAGNAVPAGFNLYNLGLLQQRMTHAVGSQVNTLHQIFTENHRQFYGLRSTALDNTLLEHGLMHYYQIPASAATPETVAEMTDLNRKLSENILHDAANHIGVTSTFTDLPAIGHLGNTGTFNERIWGKNKAIRSARNEVKVAARDEAVELALDGANASPLRCHTASVTKTAFRTKMKGLGVATVEYTATVTAQAKPMLWDTATHGPNILYRSNGQVSFSTIQAPQSLIDIMQTALAKGQRQQFPQRQRQVCPPPPYCHAEKTSMDARLMHECMNTIAVAVQHLGILQQQQPADRPQQELQMLEAIDDRFDDAPVSIKVKILMNMTNVLTGMHTTTLDRAIDCWVNWQHRTLPDDPAEKACQLLRNQWQQHLGDKRLEPALRHAVLQVTDAETVFDTAASYLTSPVLNRASVLAVMHGAVSRITETSKRAAAQARLDAIVLAQNPHRLSDMDLAFWWDTGS
ncbi:hypothetical protein QN362_12050 [Actimicrobium sp. CCC2.4]|uniref:hypothetical protein n=1 Tax=Actimicrobium sp. CCC2.4 TaxID=3048606 RepID=UPI002AC94AE7|nr:hypothetical protein [Actimicrobium sp. CCC2.4]MEB0136064.1 hypothetical protein [Actimicrobium sp. CCC2.4]WPX32178.1 hypothetical protein RHM62_18450 [Actimicrobium sp. CCC2.4]